MANLVMGVMGNLVPKLYELLKEEYGLQKGVKKRISSLTKELEGAQAALSELAKLPWDQVDKQVQLWARELREASYDMEDVLDTFLVCVQGPDSPEQKKSLLKRLKKLGDLFKTRRKISGDVEDIMTYLQEVTERCCRYKIHDIVDRPAKSSPIDPRLHALYNKVQDLVGIDESRHELISKLQPLQQDGTSNLKMKIVSIVGVGGLGKTTLAKAVYDQLQGDFICGAFVSVGRNPDLQKVLQMILIALDKETYQKFNFAVLQDITQFINELRGFLHDKKRYFIVIDDIWDTPSWEPIKLAIGDDNNCGARIVITTRNQEVAKEADEVYKLRPLPDDISKELFFTRIGGDERKLVDNTPDEVTINKFLKKCAGIPLAVITMASLLAGKPREKWDELYRSIGFGISEGNKQAQNTMIIVSFSYYDLPVHLRTCLLYLIAFPEDSVIPKDSLVWMWVAEGFVKKEQGKRLFETGEGYFHDLINRSMLEVVMSDDDDNIVTGCRVHDMVLDFIRSMSHQENFFSVVLGNDQDTLLESNNVPRRLAHHDSTMWHGRGHGDDLKVEKVRSMFSIGCRIEVSYPFHGFTFLRVLVIDNCNATEGSYLGFRNEHVRHLLHLRFLGIRRTSVERIPEGIGSLRFLQTLDLDGSILIQCPSPGSFPKQLVRLCLPRIEHSHDGVTWLTRLTSLEELSISISRKVSWQHLSTELRVLKLHMEGHDGSRDRDFWENVRHLNKLEYLRISAYFVAHVTDIILSSGLRHFSGGSRFPKLPSCVNASCLPNLSHLDLGLRHMDEHDLDTLGRLPELRFLRLALWTLATVSSVVVVSEKDAAVYFPKLRCCQLEELMVSIHANDEDKSISFHIWGGKLGKPSAREDKLQRPIISCSTGGSGGGASAGAAGGGAPRDRFMPCLQVFRFHLDSWANNWDEHSCDNLGFEYGLPSLREIGARITVRERYAITEELRRATKAHPNRPAFRRLW